MYRWCGFLPGFLLGAGVLVGCTSGGGDAPGAAAGDSTAAIDEAGTSQPAEDGTADERPDADDPTLTAGLEDQTTPSEPTTADPDGEPIPPARPGPTAQRNDGGAINLWLGRGEMSDRSITLNWALDQRVEAIDYALYRFPFDSAVDPMAVPLDRETPIHRSTTRGLVDEDVEAGAGYWYVLIARDTAGADYRRATEAHAVTDIEAPTVVTGLTATMVDDTVELRWNRSSDNYRFGRYSIRRSVDGADSIYYGTGWTVEQTTFIDDQLPAAGSVVAYELAAGDFHGNWSEPTTIELTIG